MEHFEFNNGKGSKFYTNFYPDRNFTKSIISLFGGYDLYPERIDFGAQDVLVSNKDILETIYAFGVYKIIVDKGFGEVCILDKEPKENFIDQNLVDSFNSYLKDYPRIGLFFVVDRDAKKEETYCEWLPRMKDFNFCNYPEFEVYNINIIGKDNQMYLVVSKWVGMEEDGGFQTITYVIIGSIDVFVKDKDLFITRTKMLQLQECNDHIKNIYNQWLNKYQTRRLFCNLEMNYDLTFYDLLIFLYQTYEFTKKVEDFCKTDTLLWTTKWNEFNGSFYHNKGCMYTPLVREAILNDPVFGGEEKPYGFINDFFYKKLI